MECADIISASGKVATVTRRSPAVPINPFSVVSICQLRGDCPENGVSGSTRRPAGWLGRVADDQDTGGHDYASR
jgi:hypothetical protein